jgi:hypothetical protein
MCAFGAPSASAQTSNYLSPIIDMTELIRPPPIGGTKVATRDKRAARGAVQPAATAS